MIRPPAAKRCRKPPRGYSSRTPHSPKKESGVREPILLMRRLAYEGILGAAQQSPYEICGLLAGYSNIVQTAFPLENLERSPLRYRVAVDEQACTLSAIWRLGLDWMGIYHSHRSGLVCLSDEDMFNCRVEGIWQLVIGIQEETAPAIAAFRFTGGRYEEGSVEAE